MHPVGSIYISVDATNPSLIFGGTWQQITGRFLLAAGGGYSAGTTGGEAAHKLTVAEMPSHSHWIAGSYQSDSSGNRQYATDYDTSRKTLKTHAEGGNAAHNNMPPYLAVYMWKRII